MQRDGCLLGCTYRRSPPRGRRAQRHVGILRRGIGNRLQEALSAHVKARSLRPAAAGLRRTPAVAAAAIDTAIDTAIGDALEKARRHGNPGRLVLMAAPVWVRRQAPPFARAAVYPDDPHPIDVRCRCGGRSGVRHAAVAASIGANNKVPLCRGGYSDGLAPEEVHLVITTKEQKLISQSTASF